MSPNLLPVVATLLVILLFVIGDAAAANNNVDDVISSSSFSSSSSLSNYYVFLQKFPLANTFQTLFHTEVIVCPAEAITTDDFATYLDGLAAASLLPSGRFEEGGRGDGSSDNDDSSSTTRSPYVLINNSQWSTQSMPKCVQLGYGGGSCNSGCCGSPHTSKQTEYALNSHSAIIANAVGANKELYFYGVGTVSGKDAYRAVCHGRIYAIDESDGGRLPKCVSDWSGADYNLITNNCNTFTSTILKCVYGMSDAKPNLGISDLRTVTCPSSSSSSEVPTGRKEQCVIPPTMMMGEEDGASVE
jgi:hypothetical protein